MKLKTFLSLLMIFVLAGGVLAAQKQVSDDQLYDVVRRKLANDAIVKGGALEVDVKAGVVTLRGKVETDKQKAKADKIVRKIAGVKQVNNELAVVGKGNR
jgi:osmotically-inducible protein OsmY